MTTIPGDREGTHLAFANVLTRKHVFVGGYAILSVTQASDGFDGGLGCTILDRPISEHAETQEDCCNKLEQRFQEILPDHRCGPGCFRGWHPLNSIFGEPTGPPQ